MPIAVMNGAGTQLSFPQPRSHPPPSRLPGPTKIPKAAFFARKRQSPSASPTASISSGASIASPTSAGASPRSPLSNAFGRGGFAPLSVSTGSPSGGGGADDRDRAQGSANSFASASTSSLAYAASSGPSSANSAGPSMSARVDTSPMAAAQAQALAEEQQQQRGMGRTEVLADDYNDFDAPSGVPDTFGRSSRANGYAPLSESDYEDEREGYSSASASEDRFTAVPRPSRRGRQRSTSRGLGDEVRVARSALESPPPHVRRAPEPESYRDGESHESASGTSGASGASGTSGTSAQTGMSASSLGLGGNPSLSASTSTAVTHMTTTPYAPPQTTMGPDDMLLALLAGQAAVDCGELPIGGWEEVENWKKELSILSARLEASQQKHQREVKILAAARTLSRLNSSNKRMSRQTLESLEQAERRVDAAEKEVLVLRDRESALRRRLMEHWAGVMAWEVRRLEARSSETTARNAVHSQAFEESQDREFELTQRVRTLEEQLAAGGGGGAVRSGPSGGGSREEIEELQMREQDLTHRLRAAEAELEQLTHQSRGFASERSQHSDKLRQLEAERDQHADRARGLETDLDDREQQIRRLEAERDEQVRRIASEHDDRIRQLQAERDEHIRQLQTERDEQVRQLQAERDTHADRARAFETERGSETQQLSSLQAKLATYLTQLRGVESERDQLTQRSRDIETERDGHASRIAELEALIEEYGRREKVLHDNQRALEENARSFDDAAARFAADRDEWLRERETMMEERMKERQEFTAQLDELEAERDSLLKQRDSLNRERDDMYHQHTTLVSEASAHARAIDKHKADREAWDVERQQLVAQRDEHQSERNRLVAENEQTSSLSRAALQQIGIELGALLGRGPVADSDMSAAVDELGALLSKREREIASLRAEVRGVNEAHDELNTEVNRLRADHDSWKRKAELAQREASSTSSASRSAQGEVMELVRKVRTQNDEIAALKTRLEVAQMAESSGSSSVELENKVTKLEAELSAINTALADAWGVLPAPGAYGKAGLSDPRVVSPSSVVNFAALQRAYAGPAPNDKYPGIDGLIARVKSVVADGRLMVERMARMDQEKERHKANAAKAAKLVQDSRTSLETYQRQVAELQERLALGSATQSEVDLRAEIDSLRRELDAAEADNRHLAAELHERERSRSAANTAKLQAEVDSLHRNLIDAHAENRRLADAVAAKSAAVQRLNEVNDALSARTLTMANEAAGDKAAVQARLQAELDELRASLKRTVDEGEDERLRCQDQRLALLDEVNSLQEEVTVLRNKLRAANASGTSAAGGK